MPASPTILIVDPEPAALTYLGALIANAGYATLTAPTGKEGLIEAWRHRPGLIVLDPTLPDLNGLELVRKLRSDPRTAETKIVLLAERSDPQHILEGMQAGATEYLIKREGADAELLGRIAALLPLPQAADEQSRPPGALVSFLSAKGGTGTSSLCANMAQVLARLVDPKTVAVVDLVLPIGSISQIVGVASPQTVIEATQLQPNLITPARMRERLVPVEHWKFHLLPGAPDPETAQELRVEQLEAVFAALRQAFDYVLVDFGRALSRISLPIIRSSARLVLVLSSDISTVALTQTTLKYLDGQGVRRNQIYPVLNRAVGLEGMSRGELERELSLTIAGVVPHLGGAFALANNQHLPLAVKYPNDTATFVIHDLTAGLLSQVERST
jgi:pilus assembly protein CpaE